jgi:hypothetical protein
MTEAPSTLLADLAERFPQSPTSARLKAAVLYHGVRWDDALGPAGEWAFPSHMPYQTQPGDAPYKGQNRFYIPQIAQLDDDTHFRIRIKRDSPFVIRPGVSERRFVLLEGETPVCDLTFEPKHAWAEALSADGTPMRATGLVQHGDMLVANVAPGCEYFVVPKAGLGQRTENLSCSFCLYGVPDQRMDSLGQKLYETKVPERTLDRVAEACGHHETHARHLYLVGGSLLNMAAEGERYVQIARRLADAGLAERYYIACGSGAIERRHMLELKDAGVRGACFNLEVWDPKQFERVCPGKARTVGRDRWLESLEEAVEVFGRGNVMSAFVGGVELDGEGAFDSAEAAHESNVHCGETLIPKGIVPVYSIFWKLTGKERGVEPVYSLENFLRLNEAHATCRASTQSFVNPEFFCRRCAYMEMEPDYDRASGT